MSSPGGDNAPGSSTMQSLPLSGPPYVLPIAQLGGIPTVEVDDPISGVLLGIFAALAVIHMTIFQTNQRRDHKFVFSALLFGFCMARIVALSLRLAWSSHPTNVNVAIAANVFTAAGVLLIFVVNMVFAQRMVRAYHPVPGWSRQVRACFVALYALIPALLVMVITSTVHTFFTLDSLARSMDRDVQLVAGTILTLYAFLPVPIVVTAATVRTFKDKNQRRPVEKFGHGRLRTKLILLVASSLLLTLGAGFRIGVAYAPARPMANPAWYHHRACYYCFNYAIEIVVVTAYAAFRVDLRFHVPDGSKGPGDYEKGRPKSTATAADPQPYDDGFVAVRINSEAEFFGEDNQDYGDNANDNAHRNLEKKADGEVV